jgi:diguanylate cyclase (GGDEF)-like protein
VGSFLIPAGQQRTLLVKQVAIVGTAIAASVGALAFDWCQRLCMILAPYEAYEADEYILVALFLALGLLAAFAMRERHLRFQLVMHERESRAAFMMARTDYLTGLPNRLALAEHFATMSSAAGERATILLIDLDEFKRVNDTLGHEAGDEVLKAVAERLVAISDGDERLTAFRLGGDEFAIIRRAAATPNELEPLVALVIESIEQPICLSSGPMFVGCSIGAASSDDIDVEIGGVLRRADEAMFVVKRSRRQLLRCVQ